MLRALSIIELYNEEHNLVSKVSESKMIVKISKEWAAVSYIKGVGLVNQHGQMPQAE